MKYKIFKLEFQSAVHFGKNSLEDAEYTICADTLFSAMCIEAKKMGTTHLDDWVSMVKEGKIVLSDAFPYVGERYYIPKPYSYIESKENQGNSIVKKAYKKLKYIGIDDLPDYISGKYDILQPQQIEQLGKRDIKTSVSIRGEDETKPYRVGLYYFNAGNGLYIIIGYENDENLELAEELLENLSFSGIGGKRSSGYGRFTLYSGKMNSVFEKRLGKPGKNNMLLSVALPRDEELDVAMEDAAYAIIKRSGFVESEHFSNSIMKKKDLYVFKAGSCFSNAFGGDVYDVSDNQGIHPVYRYAKTLFLEVDV